MHRPLMKRVFAFYLLAALVLNNEAILPSEAAEGEDITTAIEKVAEKVGPAVVSIKTAMFEHAYPYNSRGELDSFDQFFEEFFGMSPRTEQRRSGLGSGVIIDKQGYILTNEHVVRGAHAITVMLSDGRSFNAELQGIDQRSDLAVIKISAPDLPVAPLGNSDQLKIGQWLIAIGNPFGHMLDDPAPTVTTGVVSALHRALPRNSRRDSDYSDLIQTDAAINPGNSGGPLVNTRGEVIGINVAIFSTSGGYQGIGFAIPVNYAKALIEQVTTGKAFQSGWIGVVVQDIDYRLAQYFGLTSREGVLALKILDQSPAQIAGIKEGDIILTLNGVKVRNSDSLIRYINNSEIGREMKLKLLRDKKEIEIPITIANRPSAEPIKKKSPPLGTTTPANRNWRGLEVQELSETAGSFATIEGRRGVIVSRVVTGSPAQMAGIKEGDIILSINKNPISTVSDYQRVTAGISGSSLLRTSRGYAVIEE